MLRPTAGPGPRRPGHCRKGGRRPRARKDGEKGPPSSPCFLLLTNTQLGDEGTIALDVLLGQIVQEAAALTDHLIEAPAAVVVVDMDLQVLGELVDPLGEDSDLDLGGTGVALVGTVGLDDRRDRKSVV